MIRKNCYFLKNLKKNDLNFRIDIEIQNIDFAKIPTESLRQLEADSYWCMNKLLERIQENYVFLQPGIQKKIQSLEDLIKRIDSKFLLLVVIDYYYLNE